MQIEDDAISNDGVSDASSSTATDNSDFEINEITKVLESVNNANEEAEIQDLIAAAPQPQSFEHSKMFEPVVEREYATNPEAQLNRISGGDSMQKSSPPLFKKPLFTFLKREETINEEVEQDVNNEAPIPPTNESVHVPSMQFQEPLDPNLTASQNLTGQMGVTTSELIWNNVEHGLPELMGTYVVKISDSVVEDPIIDEATQLALKEDIAKRNKENKERFIIPEWYKDQIKKPLQALCIEKGIETSIPVGVQLMIGVVILLALFLVPTILEVKKSNELYLKRLDAHFEALRKSKKSDEG